MTETPPPKATAGFTGELFPIRAATQLCRQLLEQCATQSDLQRDHWAQSRCSDFNLWDSGIGASANELNCLDKRLERDPSAEKVVFGALSTLAAWTTKCSQLAKAADPTNAKSLDKQSESHSKSDNEKITDPTENITLDMAKNTIEGLLRILVDLEIAIRRAGTASRMRRADRTFDRRRHLYEELEKYLQFTLRVSGAPRWVHSAADRDSAPSKPDEIDVQSALDRLQEEQAPLRKEQMILLLANIKRTDRFMFYEARQEHLRSEQTQEPSQPARFQVESSRPKPSNPLTNDDEKQPRQPLTPVTNESTTKPPNSHHSTGTTNQASDYTPSSSLEHAGEMRCSGAAATAIALRAAYPKPPKDKTKCPYCLIPFRGEADDMAQWK